MIKSGNGSVLVVVFFTEKCNLNCKYCYVKQSQRTMDWEITKQSVNFISNLKYDEKTLCFMGGEPLIEWELVRKMTGYAQEKGIKNFNLCTNMTLLDQEMINFFAENRFNLMLSVDGIIQAHDSERIKHENKGSFNEVDKAVSLIASSKDRIKFTIQMCLAPSNVKYLSESFNYLFKKGIANTRVYIIPIVDPAYKWKEGDYEAFAEEKRKMLEIFQKERRSLPQCKLVFGKCCSPYGIEELKNTKSLKKELCLCKDRYYGIDIKGNVYYCFFSGFSKYKELCNDYRLGDIWKGIVRKEKLKEFTGEGMERCMSCLAWNYIVNGDIRKPAEAYKRLYEIWVSDDWCQRKYS